MDKKLTSASALNIYFLVFFAFSIYIAKFTIDTSIVAIISGILLYFYNLRNQRLKSKEMIEYLEKMNFTINTASKSSIATFLIPTMIIDSNVGEILWCNEAFYKHVISNETRLKGKINSILPSYSKSQEQIQAIKIDEKYFDIFANDSGDLTSLFFIECTKRVAAIEKYNDSKILIAIISIDNYEELTKNASDTDISNILSEINKKIGEWISPYNGMFRKYDRDKFLFVFKEQYLDEMIDQKFSVLSKVRTVHSFDGVIATLSIGIGKDVEDINEKNKYATIALDMALSRGGDQVVIKSEHNFQFFGGGSKEVERRTKVKSRVMASALNQLIKDSTNVIIMGHKNSDIDSFGAAIGICCTVIEKNKPVYIVINKKTCLVNSIVERIEKIERYKDVFIEADDAMVIMDAGTLVVVVDTNRPDYVESISILTSANKVAVIDHHRRAADYIENAAVNMHEPYASSTCELVAELMQYMMANPKILKQEAEAVLAGIYLDTKGFTIKAGVRTFEAAAYLKRAGADMIEVKKMFQNTFEGYMSKQQVIANAKNYKNNIVIALCDFVVDRAVAASAADELLNISDIEGAFVIFRDGKYVSISARSLGDINVQLITEKLGGGGNLASSGAQFENDDIYEICKLTQQAIDEYEKEKE